MQQIFTGKGPTCPRMQVIWVQFYSTLFHFLWPPPVLVCWGCHHKVPQTGRLKHRNGWSHASGRGKSKIKASVGLVPPEAVREAQVCAFHPVLGGGWNSFTLGGLDPHCPISTFMFHGVLPVCMSVSRSSLCVRTPVIRDQGPTMFHLTSS